MAIFLLNFARKKKSFSNLVYFKQDKRLAKSFT